MYEITINWYYNTTWDDNGLGKIKINYTITK